MNKKTDKTPKIKLGSKVKWTGQGRGGTKEHRGKVVQLYKNDRGVNFARVDEDGKILTPYLAKLQLA